MQIPDNIQEVLEHVLWVGGAPDSGKTSIATILAERHGFQIYHFDRHEMDHFARADQNRHPALWAAHPDRMDSEQRWLGSSPQEMADATIASWTERCEMAFEEIAGLAEATPVIAEGPGFFPDALAPILSDPRKAVWLIPTEAFKRHSAAARGKPGSRHETSNPELAAANIIARDLIMAQRIRERCTARGYACLVVTGDEGPEAAAERVEERFKPWLREETGTLT